MNIEICSIFYGDFESGQAKLKCVYYYEDWVKLTRTLNCAIFVSTAKKKKKGRSETFRYRLKKSFAALVEEEVSNLSIDVSMAFKQIISRWLMFSKGTARIYVDNVGGNVPSPPRHVF